MEEITWNKYTDEKGIDQIEKIDQDGRISYVPNDPSNSDFKEYLKSLDEPATKS